jgi:hypothetical protein
VSDYWRQLRSPLPYMPMGFDGSTPVQIPTAAGPGGLDLAALTGGAPDSTLNALVGDYLQSLGGGGGGDTGMPEMDPEQRKQLEDAIRQRFQELNQGGLNLEARPGSKLAEALATGDFSDLSQAELLQVLIALMEYAQDKNSGRGPAPQASRPNAPLAPTGSWGSNGNSYGGGGSYSGANSSAPAARGPAPAAGPIPPGSPGGVSLAESARDTAQSMNSTGWCYRGVAQAVARATGVQLTGGSAYMAADQLASNPKFIEISVSPELLKDLPPGAIVVWDRTDASPHGHISVSLGNGQEASDHIQQQMTSLRGAQNYRVFVLNEGGGQNN